MNNKKINLVICCYFGKRRTPDNIYHNDVLTYIKMQMEYLRLFKHSISQITFMVNKIDEMGLEVYQYLYSLPQYVQNATVKVIERKNVGMSYGAFSDCYALYRKQFDYYIFCEDDYFFVQDNFDKILVDMFHKYDNCGYLCGIYREPNTPYGFLPHAGNSVGISSADIIEQVYLKNNNMLPHSHESTNYSHNEINGQIAQSYAFIKAGYKIYDIREKYRVPFSQRGILDYYFPENEESLIVPVQWLYKDENGNK